MIFFGPVSATVFNLFHSQFLGKPLPFFDRFRTFKKRRNDQYGADSFVRYTPFKFSGNEKLFDFQNLRSRPTMAALAHPQ